MVSKSALEQAQAQAQEALNRLKTTQGISFVDQEVNFEDKMEKLINKIPSVLSFFVILLMISSLSVVLLILALVFRAIYWVVFGQ
jgi:uncharacterized protein YjaG (DUF416 family)